MLLRRLLVLELSRMTNSGSFVHTMNRLIQWRFDDSSSKFCRIFDAVSLGKWNWDLRLVMAEDRTLCIKLSCHDILPLYGESVLIVSFNIRVVSLLAHRKILFQKEIRDKPLNREGGFFSMTEVPLAGRFIIDVEFLDIKTISTNGCKALSIWNGGCTQNSTAVSPLGKMLSESIHTDLTICASDGTIGAHRAVLAARSPVFTSMFTHHLKEKEMSVINISDMSIDVCRAFLSCLYSNIRDQDFATHRLDLLVAADKYDISDLKGACEESLIQDIDTKNVMERLKFSVLYGLPRLKGSCIRYLVKFGKIFDVREEFDDFIQSGEREIIGEVINEVLSTWGGF